MKLIKALFWVLLVFTTVKLSKLNESMADSSGAPSVLNIQKELDTNQNVPDLLPYMKGREKSLEGDYEGAAPFFEQALKQDPNSASLNHELSEVYLRLSSLDRAEALCLKAVELSPKNPEFRMTLGGIFASEKKYDEAKVQYLKVQELDPSNVKIPLLLGILEAESGKLEEGIKTLTKAIDSTPDNFMAHFYRAKIYLEMEDIAHAKADLESCLNLRPSFVEAGVALGTLYERLGDVDNAVRTYSRIQGVGSFKKRLGQLYLTRNEFDKALMEFLQYEESEPDDYTVKVKIGLIYFELKKYQDSIARFKDILNAQPDAGNVRFYLGIVYEEIKNMDQAIIELKKVPVDSSFYKEAVLHTGFILKEQGKIKEGIEYSKKNLASNPETIEFYDLLASFYEAKKSYDLAQAVIGKGLKRFPKDERLLYFSGALSDKLGKKEEAIDEMKKILEINENNAHALNFLGYTYAELGRHLEEAETMVQKALTLRPNDGYIQDSLGWVLFKKGKIDEAIERLQSAAKVETKEPIIYEHLGDVYAAKKDVSKAIDAYKTAMQLSVMKKDSEMEKKLLQKVSALEGGKRTTAKSITN